MGGAGYEGMHLELTDEQKAIQAVARDFAEKEVRPIAEAIDREARFPRDTVRRMGELGLMGIFIPEDWGGSGADAVAYALAVEELARICASHAVIMATMTSRRRSSEAGLSFIVLTAAGRERPAPSPG